MNSSETHHRTGARPTSGDGGGRGGGVFFRFSRVFSDPAATPGDPPAFTPGGDAVRGWARCRTRPLTHLSRQPEHSSAAASRRRIPRPLNRQMLCLGRVLLWPHGAAAAPRFAKLSACEQRPYYQTSLSRAPLTPTRRTTVRQERRVFSRPRSI